MPTPDPIKLEPFPGPDAFPRYEFDFDVAQVWDTKFGRVLATKCQRGGEPYFRLVHPDDSVSHCRVADIFGPDALPPERVDTDFDPVDFAEDYDFDPDGKWVRRRRAVRGAAAGTEMKLLDTRGWRHWQLTRRDGRRVCVTPTEVRVAFQRTKWNVPLPTGARQVRHIFPNLAFTPDGRVWEVRRKGDTPLLRPEPVAPDEIAGPGSKNPDHETVYRLTSSSGKVHRFRRQAIKDLFNMKRRDPHAASS